MDKTIILSGHAREKMIERGVTFQEIEDVIRYPEIVTPDSYGPGRRKFMRGDITVVVAPGARDPEALVVVTVLWFKQEQWTSEQMRDRK